MITLRLGDLAVRIDTAPVRPALETLLTKLVSMPGDTSSAGVLLQLGVSKLAGLILWYMRIKGLEAPAVPKKADPTPYLLQHFAGLMLAELEAREWECSYVESVGESGAEIEITGLAPVAGAGTPYPALGAPAPVVDAGATVASDGGDGDSAEYGHGLGDPGSDPGEPGGQVASDRDDGVRQDDSGQDDSAGRVAAVAAIAAVLH